MGRADHIYVSRGIYTHHGIDAGDGTVIHFSGEPKGNRDADIKRSTLTEFLSGGTLSAGSAASLNSVVRVVRSTRACAP